MLELIRLVFALLVIFFTVIAAVLSGVARLIAWALRLMVRTLSTTTR